MFSKLACTVVITVFVLSPVGALAADLCDDAAPAAPVRLVAAHPSTTEEETATRDEMDHRADQLGASAAVREAHPLMLSIAQAGTHVEIDHRTIAIHDPNHKDQGYVCDVPTSVVVIFGAFKSRLILNRDAAAVPCVREVLLEHHAHHSRALDAQIELFVAEHRDSLARDARELMRKRARDQEAATQAFEHGMASLAGALYSEFEGVIDRSRKEADSPTALAKLRNACDGQLYELEHQVTAPGRAA